MINAIIVDDEAKSRESLKILLEDFCSNVLVSAMCRNVAEGMEAIHQHNPDVVFLDIQMQRETGFDLLNRLETTIRFEVIFTTAYSEYAIKAFKFSAIDYLLKPIDIEELKLSLQKVEKKMMGNISERLGALIRNLALDTTENYKLALPTAQGLVFVRVKEISYCEAQPNATLIHMTDGRKYEVSRPLKEYEDLLADQQFFRIHNAYLINLREIKRYIQEDGGQIVLHNDIQLEVSKRRQEAFLHRLSSSHF